MVCVICGVPYSKSNRWNLDTWDLGKVKRHKVWVAGRGVLTLTENEKKSCSFTPFKRAISLQGLSAWRGSPRLGGGDRWEMRVITG